MKNINLTPSITLTEYGISGFTLKDTTGISTSSIYPEISEVSANYLRTKDIIFVDIVILNMIDEPKRTVFYYDCKSDDDYNNYKLDYITKIDGRHIIDHLILPKYEWLHSLSPQSLNMSNGEIFYVADVNNNEITYYEIKILDNSYSERKITEDELYLNITNSNIIGIEEELFLLGNLEKCYEDKLKYIYYNNLYHKCNIKNDNNISQVFRDRNIVFIALELIKGLIKRCEYYEAQRIIEEISFCGGFCNNDYLLYNSLNRCNCVGL